MGEKPLLLNELKTNTYYYISLREKVYYKYNQNDLRLIKVLARREDRLKVRFYKNDYVIEEEKWILFEEVIFRIEADLREVMAHFI